MNPTIDLLLNRYSVRSYSDREITTAEKDLILQTTMRAPTAGALMLYSIIDITDQAMKDKLAVSCDHQPFIAKAPWLLLFLADYQRWMDLFEYSKVNDMCSRINQPRREPAEGDLLLACCDALIAAQTAVIAAESLGIGSCYIGDILENATFHRQLFNLPRYTLPITMICFGFPAGVKPEWKSPRFDRRFILHTNHYRRIEPEETDELTSVYSPGQGKLPHFPAGAENYGQAVFLRKFIAAYSYEMNRSVKEMLGFWKG